MLIGLHRTKGVQGVHIGNPLVNIRKKTDIDPLCPVWRHLELKSVTARNP